MEKIHYEKQKKKLESFLKHIANKGIEAGLLEPDEEVKTRQDLENLRQKASAVEQTPLIRHVVRHCNYALTSSNSGKET